jgi:hypothetical protein
MPHRANSAFSIDTREDTPTSWERGHMNRARWTKSFTGDLSGSSVVELILVSPDGEGPAVYVGIERFDCTLNGRSGSFVLVHSATMLGDDHQASWQIVPGSGTDELTGIHGHGEILPNHDFVLHYEIDP